jgi:hypothetical protein
VLTQLRLVDPPALPAGILAGRIQAASCLRWTFQRDGSAITCEIKVGGAGRSAAVHVVPDWDSSLAHVEPAVSTVAAMQRHAEIAQVLRDAGWWLTSRA